MNDPKDQLVYERGLAFFGRMTAGVSHEMKNVLGIINELGGLIDDLLHATQNGGQIAPEQLGRIAEGIGKQVRRGDGQIKSLHHFAHNVDDFESNASLAGVIEEIVALCQRLARLKKAQLAVEFQDDLTVTVDKMFTWQHTIYECICLALEDVQPDDVVAVRLVRRDETPCLEIASPRGLCERAIAARMSVLEALAAELGSTIELIGDGTPKQALAISIPA